MARTKIWNQAPLKEAFDDYRRGEAGSDALRLLDSRVTPAYVGELLLGTQELLAQKGAVSEYGFSDAAIRSVRQDRETYLRDASIPKRQLVVASVTQLTGGETRLARLYDTQLTLGEVLRRQNLTSDSLKKMDERLLTEASADVSFDLGHPYNIERQTNILYPDLDREPGGETIHVHPVGREYPEGGTNTFPNVFRVADFITIGNLIDYDLSH